MKPIDTMIRNFALRGLCLTWLFVGLGSAPGLELTGRKVVIDPGHGGTDPGAVGIDGSGYPNEEDFNLAVGLRLRTLLQNAGCTVVMTRSTDTTVSLTARRDLANAENPDAFISIHCNSYAGTTAVGTETFWCLDYCNGNSAFDQDLATKVQNRLLQFLGRPNRGVKRANFTVLSAVPPSCLGEMLFISTQAEFDIINSTAGQDNAAKGFFYGAMDRMGITAPATPTGLTAAAVSASQINLSWTDNSGIEDSFKIERALASGGPWTEIASVTANVKTFSNTGLSGGTTYYYRVRAYNSVYGNSAYSGVASATTPVSGVPVITSQPASRTVNPGATVTFSVTATGTAPLSYQWRRNGVNLTNTGKFSGVNTATLTITNVQQTEVGNYDVVVANAVGSVTSATATLAVNAVVAFEDTFETGNLNAWAVASNSAAPSATMLTISTAQNHTPGGTYSAKVSISTDRMYRNIGAEVSGRCKATFWIYDSTQTRVFTEVRAYSGDGFEQGSLQQLLAIGKYNTVTLPGETYDSTKYQGRIAFGPNAGWFNLNAPGAPSRSTGWHKFEIERLADGSTVNWYVDGVLSRTFTGLTLPPWDCVVVGSVGASSTLGDAWVDDFKVEYYDPPIITAHPTARTNAIGTTAVFTVGTSNTVTGYQWRRNGVNLAGATTATLTLSNVQPADAARYDVVVSNGAGPVLSQAAELWVLPVIMTQPVSQTNIPGATVWFNVAAVGQPPVAFQWRKNGIPLADGGRLTGATTATLEITSIESSDAGAYTVVVNNPAGSVTSIVATLTVAVPPVVVTQPAGRAVAAGATVAFSVTAEGTPPLSYQWLFEETEIPGATNATLTLNNVQSAQVGRYQARVSSPYGIAFSEEAELVINNPPVLTPVADRHVPAGGTVAFALAASDPDAGQTLTFTLEAGAPAAATLNPTNGWFAWPTAPADAGTTNLITVRVTDDGLPPLSTTASFSITVIPAAIVQSVRHMGELVLLEWNTFPGHTYRVQFKDNLTDAAWTDLAPDVTATGATTAVELPMPASQRYYRVRLVE